MCVSSECHNVVLCMQKCSRKWYNRCIHLLDLHKNVKKWEQVEVQFLSQRHWQTTQDFLQTLHLVRDQSEDLNVTTRQRSVLLSSGFTAHSKRSWGDEQVSKTHILFCNHPKTTIFLQSVHIREKQSWKKIKASQLYGSQRESSTLLLCLSQSHIRSDHWQIKALPDTSLPLSGGSWHALATWNDRVVAGGWRRETFFDRAKGRSEGRREPRGMKGKAEVEEGKIWVYRKYKKVKTTFLLPEIHSALWGQEEEDSERQMGEETLRIV